MSTPREQTMVSKHHPPLKGTRRKTAHARAGTAQEKPRASWWAREQGRAPGTTRAEQRGTGACLKEPQIRGSLSVKIMIE